MSGNERLTRLGAAARVVAVGALSAGLTCLLVTASPSSAQQQTVVGSNFALPDRGGRNARLTWDNPGAATSLTLMRIGNVSAVSSTPLDVVAPPSLDTSLGTGDTISCWQLLAQPGNARSDLLCMVEMAIASGDVGPATIGAAATNLRIVLGQSTSALLSWTPAAGSSLQGIIQLVGAPTELTVLSSTASSLTDEIGPNAARCYDIFSVVASAVTHTNLVCGVTGLSNLPPRAGTATPTPTPVAPTATATPTATGTPTATNTPTPLSPRRSGTRWRWGSWAFRATSIAIVTIWQQPWASP